MIRKYFGFIILLNIIILVGSCSTQPINRPSNWAKKINSNSFENLYKVSDSLYRSEQPNKIMIKELERLGVKSILNLRTSDTDEELSAESDLYLYSVEMRAENIDDKKVLEALRVIKNAPKPILIHCKHGSDRTGLIVALYRIVFEGWAKISAIDELKNGGYGFHSIFINIPEYIEDIDIEQLKKSIM